MIVVKGKSGRNYHVYIEHSSSSWYEIRVYSEKRGLFGRKLLNSGFHSRYRRYCSEKYGDDVTLLIASVVDEIDIEYRRKDSITQLERGKEEFE